MGGRERTLRSPVKHMFARHGLSWQAGRIRLAALPAGASATRR